MIYLIKLNHYFHIKSIHLVQIIILVVVFLLNVSHQVEIHWISYKNWIEILDPNSSKFWIKNYGKTIQNLSESFLFINKINQNSLGEYQCLSSNENINLNITKSNLLSHRLPFDKTSNLYIEFISSINQLKLGGNILINCSSTDQTLVQWLETKNLNGIIRNNSYLHIPKFSTKHFDYYYCSNKNSQKILSLSPNLFELIQNINSDKQIINKYNTSFIEIIKGKYVGDNITLICRIGRGEVLFDLIWFSK